MSKNKVTVTKDNRKVHQKNPWQVRWWGEVNPETLTQKHYCRKFRTRVQAERFQTKKQSEIFNGESRDVLTITLKQLCQEFLDSKDYRPSTLIGYDNTTKQLLQYFSPTKLVHTITRQEAKNFIKSREIVHPDHVNNGKDLSGWGRKSHLRHTNSIMNYAIEMEYLKKNQFAKITCKTPEGKEWHYFTPDEFNLILSKTTDTRLRCLYSVMYGCGLREGEALNLLWNGRDIDFDRGQINIKNRSATTKTPGFHVKDKDSRSLLMPKWVSDMLTQLQEQSEPGNPFVFLTADRWSRVQKKWAKMRKEGRAGEWENRHLSNNLLRNFKLVCRNCGIITDEEEKVTLHCLRKSFAMSLAQEGIPIVTLSQLMGHSSIRVTEQYYLKTSDANQVEACQVMERIMEQGVQGGEEGDEVEVW